MKRIYPIIFILLLISLPAFAQKSLNIAVVDTDKVFGDSVWGKNAILEMEKETEKWQKEGEKIDKQLADLEEKLTKQQAFLDNKEEEKKLVDEIDLKRTEGQKLVQDGNIKLKQKRDELLQPILDEVKNLIKKLALEDGYDLVLEKQLIVLYLNPELDITNRITVMLDRVYKEMTTSKTKESEKAPEKAVDVPKEK